MHESARSNSVPEQAEQLPEVAPAPSPAPAPTSMLHAAGAHIGGAALQRKLARRMVQRKASDGGAAASESIHQAAAEGISGGSQALPHLDKIQASFGHHDVTGTSAHVGGVAETANKKMGAEAYAVGNSVAFASAPDLHTAAHEAAHVVQQRGGVSLKGGVGEEGDPYERHADAVADAVVQGRSAQGLLDAHAGPTSGGAGHVQRKAASDQSAQTTQAGADKTLTLTAGELTATGEGSDAATKYIHWPHTDASGVTLGKGYDIGSRSADKVIAELTAAGMDATQAEKISKGAGLKGSQAGTFVDNNKKDIGEIPRDVQYALLATMLQSYTTQAHDMATSTKATKDGGGAYTNAAGREIADGKAAGTYVLSEDEWKGLHPAMIEFLTDLKYQGGYYAYDRIAQVNLKLKQHVGNQLEQFKAVRELFTGDYMDNYAGKIGESKGGKGSKETFYGQEVSLEGEYRRNQIRLAYLNQVITALEAGKTVTVGGAAGGSTNAAGGTTTTTQLPDGNKGGGGDKQTKPAVVGKATAKVAVNIRQSPSLDGKKLGLLAQGSSVDVKSVANGWLQIEYQGKAAYITANAQYVDYKATEQPKAAADKSAAGAPAATGGSDWSISGLAHSAGEMLSGAMHGAADIAESAWESASDAASSGLKSLKSIFGGGTETHPDTQTGAKTGDSGAAPTKQPDELTKLMAKDRLTPEEIAQARALIEKLPGAEQSKYYLALQSKAEYQNQRDNRQAVEKSTGGTCNLTSLAMALEYLGVKNPHPDMQYDEALVKIAQDKKYGDITSPDCWKKVANHLGVMMDPIVMGDQKVARTKWEKQVRDEHLAQGHGVICSIVGHIVRVQEVNDKGLVVDNPYGLEKIGKGTDHTWVRSNKGKDGWGAGHKENEGEDNTWPWSDVESHTFRSIIAFHK